jgi:RNA polymerase sigma-70 factor (ECF subfamily)
VDERRAIERLKQGDIGGLEVLVRRYQARAVQAAYLICRDRALAEDVAQNAFVRAYEGIGRFDAKRPFGPWFMKVVLNDAVKTAARREQTLTLAEADASASWLMDPERGPEELAEEAEVRRRVWEAIKKLSPAQRAVIVQRYYLGMSEAEMAQSRGSPPGTIGWRLHAARKALSRKLHPWFRAQAAPATPKRPAPTGVSPYAPEGGKSGPRAYRVRAARAWSARSRRDDESGAGRRRIRGRPLPRLLRLPL